MFYDDETTVAFLEALYRLMRQNPHLNAIVALEKRIVFSAFTMSSISLGYDAFQEHLCSHDWIHHTPVRSAATNQVFCQQCANEAGDQNAEKEESRDSDLARRCISRKRMFVARALSVDEVPHVFQYERVSTLMLWEIVAIVAPDQPTL